MNETMPHTPFSTPLSRSARETERRIQNIMTGPQRRPPIPLLILVCSLCLLCGNLVSCHMAEAEGPEEGGSSSQAGLPEGWTEVELDAGLLQYVQSSPQDWFEEYYSPTPEEAVILENLPADELPKEAVESYDAHRQDYWRDMLLPVAYDEAADVTVYFVVSPASMPNVEPLVSPMLRDLEQRGIVLRYGDRAKYFHLCWDGNTKYGCNPLLLVDDFDSDGQPEAAVVLTLGGGTGAYEEDLYIFDLETMEYTVPDYASVPLEIAASPDRNTVLLASGEQTLEMDISELEDRFDGKMMVGNIIYFYQRDPSVRCEQIETGNGGVMFAMLMQPRLLCELDVDFTCDTLGYMARVFFPVVCEDGVYKLGPAEIITDDMFADGQELCERSIQ